MSNTALPPIDSTGTVAATAAYAAARERLSDHELVVAAHERALASANKTLETAIRGVASGNDRLSVASPHRDQRIAEDELALQHRLHHAMVTHVEECRKAVHAAQADELRPRLRLAAEESIAAAQEFQDALLGMTKAVQRKLAANTIARSVAAGGLQLPFDGAHLEPKANHPALQQPPEFKMLLKTPDLERELWKDVL